MDIAALSVGLSQMRVQQQASLSVMRLAMNTTKIQADALAETMAAPSAPPVAAQHPYSGRLLDIKV